MGLVFEWLSDLVSRLVTHLNIKMFPDTFDGPGVEWPSDLVSRLVSYLNMNVSRYL